MGCETLRFSNAISSFNVFFSVDTAGVVRRIVPKSLEIFLVYSYYDYYFPGLRNSFPFIFRNNFGDFCSEALTTCFNNEGQTTRFYDIWIHLEIIATNL